MSRPRKLPALDKSADLVRTINIVGSRRPGPSPFSEELIADLGALLSARAGRTFERREIEEAAENLARFFGVMADWAREIDRQKVTARSTR
jgi:hypothetical protein